MSLPATFSFQQRNSRQLIDVVLEALLTAFIWAAGIAGLCSVAAVFVVLTVGAAPAWYEIATPRFFIGADWAPMVGKYEILLMIIGTITVSLGALIVAAPAALLCAIYLEFYANPNSRTALRLILLALAGIPSVVYGLWGLTTLVPMITSVQPPGTSLLAGASVLSVMILPTIAILVAAALREVPKEIYHGSLALGCCKHEAILRVVLPTVKSSIFAALVLGLARALGETMAVLMVTGNSLQPPSSIFSPVRTLPANIALEMAYATDKHRAALIACGIVLTAVVLGLHFLTRRGEPCDAV